MKTKIKEIHYSTSLLDGLPIYLVCYEKTTRGYRSYYDLPLTAKLFLAVATFESIPFLLNGRLYTIDN